MHESTIWIFTCLCHPYTNMDTCMTVLLCALIYSIPCVVCLAFIRKRTRPPSYQWRSNRFVFVFTTVIWVSYSEWIHQTICVEALSVYKTKGCVVFEVILSCLPISMALYFVCLYLDIHCFTLVLIFSSLF